MFLFLLDGWRIGAPILHGCKFFSEEIKKRDTRKKTFGSFHASSAAQRFFFHHMLIVVAPPPIFCHRKHHHTHCCATLVSCPGLPRTSHRLETITQSRKSPQFLGDGHRANMTVPPPSFFSFMVSIYPQRR